MFLVLVLLANWDSCGLVGALGAGASPNLEMGRSWAPKEKDRAGNPKLDPNGCL